LTLQRKIEDRWNSLTKPPGSLGRLEQMVTHYGRIRDEAMPSLKRKGMYIFCGDHGVTAEGVSSYPREVTGQMMRNFLAGGAAISVLCRRFAIEPVVVDAGVIGEAPAGVVDRKVAAGTRNFCTGPAMTRAEVERAIEAGRELAGEAATRFDIAGAGEMGIGNSTAAAALLCAFTGLTPDDAVGCGAGVDAAGLARKTAAVRRALTLHQPDPEDGIGVLASVGGFEIAMIAGFVLEAAVQKLPVVLDGFIATSAALAVKAIEPAALATVFYSHRSAERGHARMLGYLDAEVYYSLDLRLGEGTGAALTINLLKTALTLYHEMATFDEAGVSR